MVVTVLLSIPGEPSARYAQSMTSRLTWLVDARIHGVKPTIYPEGTHLRVRLDT